MIGQQVVMHPDRSPMGGYYFRPDSLTLVDRPKRKLRVGSVWERHSAARPVQRYAWTGGDFVGCPGAFVIDRGDFDSHPERWREVPVEELEREAEQ